MLDLLDVASCPTDVVDVVTRACQRRLTTADRLRQAAGERKQLRHRTLLGQLLLDVEQGAHSALELVYLREVERAHRLPPAARQRAGHTRSATWRDVTYAEFGVIVELDGSAAHPRDARHEDQWRDNEAQAVRDGITLRYGWRHAAGDPCRTADQVARVLQARGWRGEAKPCESACRLGESRRPVKTSAA